MEDNKKIIIDFTNIDIKVLDKNEKILHKDSYNKVIALLKDDVQLEIDNRIEFEDFHRTHNAIFVEGGRGSGKTQFLLSLKRCKNTYYKEDKDIQKMYFIGPIDPTILHDNESFLTIVLARILNQIEPNLKNINEHKKKNFYELLKSISFAIDGVINKKHNSKTALEHIAQDQSSLKLESYLHDFFREVSEIVTNKRLVLLIDDIDMAFDKGFEILEVIRKYLSSPYLVPVITGDKWLYEDILEQHFFSELNNDYFVSKYYQEIFDINVYNRDTISELQKDYLIKVLPQHRRVKLKTLFELSKENILIFKYNNNEFIFQQNNMDGFFYKQVFYDAEKTKNDFMKGLFSNSLRKITQFLHGEYMIINDKNNDGKQYFSLHSLKAIKEIARKYNLNNIVFLAKNLDLYQKGLEEFQKGKFEGALESFKESYKLKELIKTLEYIGLTYFAQANYKSAIEIFQKVIKEEPTNSDIIYKLAYGLAQLNQHRKAIDNYKKVLEIVPNNANTYNSLGLSYIALGEYSKAFESLKTAMNLKENYYKPYINIFEIALIDNDFFIENKKEIEELKVTFNREFETDKVALKSYSMLEQLYAIVNKRTTKKQRESDFEDWREEYKDIISGEWNFSAIENWAKGIKNQAKQKTLLEYIDKFKEVM